MPKYHLVSDVLQDLVIDDEGMGFASVRKIIAEEWADGKIKLLRVSPESAEPEVWEPAQRQLTIEIGSGERWIRCRISQGIKVLFENPFISNEDVQYVKGRVVAAGLVLAEPLSPTETQPNHLDHCVREPPNPEPEEIPASAPEEMAETEDMDIAKASSEVAIATPSQAIEQRPKPKRTVYRSDLAIFMGRKGLKLMQRMTPKDIAKSYIDDHSNREHQGERVPKLPHHSNRPARIANQVKQIRQEMENEAARQAPSSVA